MCFKFLPITKLNVLSRPRQGWWTFPNVLILSITMSGWQRWQVTGWSIHLIHHHTSLSPNPKSETVWAWQTHPEGNLTAVMTALHVLVLLPVLPGVSGIDRRYWCWYLWTHSDLVSHCPSPGHAEPGLLHLSTETVWCIPLVCTIMWPSPSYNNW